MTNQVANKVTGIATECQYYPVATAGLMTLQG